MEGLSDEELMHIWNRFYKIDESRNRADGGTGIGLSIVKAIMNNYGNEFGARNVEGGVEFYFDLDLKQWLYNHCFFCINFFVLEIISIIST